MAPKATKKAATPTKAPAKGASQKYEYVDLNKVSLTSTEHHHVYGVIIDATFPHKVNADKYVCSLKIIDPSLHQKGNKSGDNDFATVVIYAKRFEDLPICQKVGDIIRLHRATLRMWKNQRQFNLSTHWNGSWALFNSEDASYNPISWNGKRATFEKHENVLLSSLRKWTKEHLSSHDGVTKDLY